MKLLLRHAKIISPGSTYHGQTKDIRVENGKITDIDTKLESNSGEQLVEVNGLSVSPGWLDMRARFGEPGFEYKEDLLSGAKAAAAGGYTAVAILPDTFPVIQTKAEIEYVLNKSKSLPVEVLPYGAVSQDLEGEEITEMFDMQSSGAAAFSNAGKSMKSGAMQRALMYAKGINALVQVLPYESSLVKGGQMHEGYQSTILGLKGIPAHSESIAIHRDIELLKYTEGKLHFNLVSTKAGLDLIRKAKADGLNVTCDVAAYQLALDDSLLDTYDTNYKVFPPLRNDEEVKALREGVLDGSIDAVVSNHHPEDPEHKEVEFDYAAFGMIGLQESYGLLIRTFGDKLSDEKLVELLSIKPRQILDQEVPSIEVGVDANLTLFTREEKQSVSSKNNRSKARNTPLMGAELPAKVIGIINKGQIALNT